MKVRIELGNGADLTITGTSTGAYKGESYMGTLMLRKAISGLEGGDECWVNGVWVVPCPSSGKEGDESGEGDTTVDE